ncbi:MAG: MBL fold metallo-hydrolase [Gemmatimonadetes bacterium]|nr:MBL fold metallo-hydrolase [Gemmatimonadota bacterium]
MPRPGPTLRWVNHASFVLTHGDVALLTDPWLFGRAFNDGWALIAETRFRVADFAGITHLWFSHEHPDHFAPRVLAQIPADVRAGITVLFQETRDQKVVRHCRSLGFAVTELRDRAWHVLAPDVRVKCGKVPYIDSWLLVEAGGRRLLDANDCVVDGDGIAREIARETGKVDVLLTQFSYANWIGNPDERAARVASAREKLERVRLQVAAFAPDHVIPCASMVCFCHEENHYLNDAMNTVRDAHAFIDRETGARPVVLYPGDTWEVGTPHDSAPALARYDSDYRRCGQSLVTSPPVPLDELARQAREYVARVTRANNRALIALLRAPPLRYFQPLRLYLTDLDRCVTFDWRSGLTPAECAPDACDAAMGSQSLSFVFAFDFGYETLEVNGRFRASAHGHRKMVKSLFLGPLNNTGRYLRLRMVFDLRFLVRALAKLRALARRSDP